MSPLHELTTHAESLLGALRSLLSDEATSTADLEVIQDSLRDLAEVLCGLAGHLTVRAGRRLR